MLTSLLWVQYENSDTDVMPARGRHSAGLRACGVAVKPSIQSVRHFGGAAHQQSVPAGDDVGAVAGQRVSDYRDRIETVQAAVAAVPVDRVPNLGRATIAHRQ
jgi:hypothetical protein